MLYKSYKRALLASTSITKVQYRGAPRQPTEAAAPSEDSPPTHHEFKADELTLTPPTSGLD